MAALLAWLIVGGWIAAATDVVPDPRWPPRRPIEEGVDAPRAGAAGPSRRAARRVLVAAILAARLIALLPFAVAVAIGVARIVAVTYVELTRPVDVATPLVARGSRAAPWASSR